MGTSSAQKSMFFFLSSSCYFSSSALVLLESMDKFEHMYASELQLSTRFPFHCQDRCYLQSNGGLKMRSKNMLKKWFQRVPKWTPKVVKNRWKRVLRGLKKGTSKRNPLQEQEKVRSGCYLLHFSNVGSLKKRQLFGDIFGTIWETKLLK